MTVRQPIRLLLPALAAVLLAGCGSPASQPEELLVARCYLEVRPGEAGLPVQLPVSGVAINVNPKPVIVEYDFTAAQVAEVELGRCLVLRLTPAAARDFHRLSVSAPGRRLVLTLNDRVLGARRIEQPMPEGTILVFLEVPDAELPALAARLQETSARIAATRKPPPP